MTLTSSFYGGILGIGEYSYLYGISNWVTQGAPYYVFAALFAFILAARVRRTNLLSIPDQLHRAYDRRTAVLGSFLTFLLSTPAPSILMLAVLLQLFTGWSLPLCLGVGTAATTIYLFWGGFRSDVNTDVLEFFLMFAGFGLILPFAAAKFGGLDFLRANLPPAHLTWNGGNTTGFVIVWFFIALWTFVDPTFFQRCYAAKSERVAKWGILVSILFWFVFDAITSLAGLYARAALPGLSNPMMSYPLLAEATLPSVAKGFFYVGMLATIMSTLNSQAFVAAQTLGRDVYWRLRGETDERNVNRYTRAGLAVTALVSIALALWSPSVVRIWYTLGTVVIPGLLVPLLTSYFPRFKIPPRDTFVVMLAGWLTSLGCFAAGRFVELPIEPMYPGLGVSLLLWGFGWTKSAYPRASSEKT
jgi:SSS family solute:Na+ symporter